MFNPFQPVTTYAEMLNKIAFYTWAGAVAITAFLQLTVPDIEKFLAPYSVAGSVLGVPIPLGSLVPGFAIAFVARIFKLHDRISDLFRIRERFDATEILLPLALLSRSSISVDSIRSRRRDLMSTTFYAFASSSPGPQSIPAHYVTMALDQWSWYWVLVENTIILIVGASLAAAFKHYGVSTVLVAGSLVLVLAVQGIRILCARSAFEEVKQILADSARAQTVRTTFNAIQS